MSRADGQSRGMRVLVTGAAGFIGSHLCDRLLADGHGVWGLDGFDASYSPEAKRRNLAGALEHTAMHLVEGDIRDEILLAGLFSSVPFDLVVHLAARPDAGSSLAQPGVCWDVNVTGTLRLLEAMRQHHVGRLILGSSAEVYGRRPAPAEAAVESEAADRPRSPYAASKRAAELLCHAAHAHWGLSVHCLRMPAVYGPRQRPDQLIATATAGLRAKERIRIHGDATAAADYAYVTDVVSGIMLSAGKLRERAAGDPTSRVINLPGASRPDLEVLVEALASVLDARPRVSWRPAAAGAAPPVELDGTVAARELGYRPKVKLEDGLRHYVEWLELREASTEAASPSLIA